MKKFLTLIAAVLLTPLLAFAVQITVPSAPSANFTLQSNAAGNYLAVLGYFSTTSANAWKSATTFTGASTTLLTDINTFTNKQTFGNASTSILSASTFCLTGDTCRTTWPTGGGAWPFTPATNFGISVQSTSTPEWFTTGLHASSTSQFVNANFYGNVGIGTTTPNTLLTIGGAGATGAANGLNFSGDTSGNLYRLQAGIIKSDGSIYSAANVGAGNSFYFYNSNLLMAATAAVADVGNAYTFMDSTGVNYRQIKASSLYLASTSSATPYFVATINGAVGIGTSTPWGILSVVSSTTSAIPQLVVGSSTAISMFVSNLGNVGIGNVNPATTLDVTGTLHTTGGIGLGLSPIATDLTIFTNSVNGPFGARIYNQNTSGANASAFVQLNNSNFNTYMELQGSAVATSSYVMPNAFDFRNDGQGINFAATRADGLLSFWTGGTNERMRISAAGNIGVASSTPWGLLSVQAPANSAVPQFVVGSSTVTSLLVSNTGNVGIGSTTIPTSPLTLNIADNNAVPSFLITDGTIKWGMWTGVGQTAQFGTQTNNSFTLFTNNATVATFNTDKSVLFAGNPTVAAGAYLSTQGRTGGAANGDILYNSGTSQNLILAEISGGNYVFGAGSAGGIPSSVLSLNLGSAFVGIGTSTPGSILSINNVANFTSATSTMYADLQVRNLNVTGTATTTAANGINLAAGCFAISGMCLVSATSLLSSANTWTGLNSFSNASSTGLTALTNLWIPSSASQAPIGAGQLAFDTTDNQLVIGNGATTTVFDARRMLTVSYATTTAWAGTTTLPALPIPIAMQLSSVQCKTDAGTLVTQVTWGQPTFSLAPLSASTTMGNFTFNNNNTISAGTTTSISFGNPASSPQAVTCTFVVRTTGT